MFVHPSRSARAKVTVRAIKLAAMSAGVMLLALVVAAPSSAKTIHTTAATKLSFSANKAPDGTLTANGAFTSKNPRCLSRRRFKPYLDRFGSSSQFALYYGEWIAEGQAWDPKWYNAKGPSGHQFLLPVSPPGHSPWRFQFAMPGNAQVWARTTSTSNAHAEVVGNATGVQFTGIAPGTGHYGMLPYRVTYRKDGNEIILSCSAFSSQFQDVMF
ncbi:MAG: hypothetical protein WBM00_06155 [Solirubrobacterales bacterium]